MREYQRTWLRKRRDTWLLENGPCRGCGSLDDLEVDHIDPTTKELKPTHIWSRRKDIRKAELAKCQVLCRACHNAKSRVALVRLTHGKAHTYKNRGCRCELCKIAYSSWRKKRYQRSGL